jgi:hypothetical protein
MALRLEGGKLSGRLIAEPQSAIAAQILALLRQRAPLASICPSVAPRSLFKDWREHMPMTRLVAAKMARDSVIQITQGSLLVDPNAVEQGLIKGPIRLRRGPLFPEA